MTPAQVTELEAIWEREIGARKGSSRMRRACAEETRKPTTKRKVLKARVTGDPAHHT